MKLEVTMTTFRRTIKNLLVPIFVGIDRLLVRLHIVRPRVVIYMDGGLCSQMNMWVQGQYYAEQGLDVYYDLAWFRREGKGIDGVSVRNYELETLWPEISVRTLSPSTTQFYRYLLPYSKSIVSCPLAEDIHRSVYFNGYNRIPEQDRIRLYRNFFSYESASKTERMLIENGKRYCGVHVRRGDLVNMDFAAYPQVADGYFVRAIEYVSQYEKVDEFLLFSEDAQWLRKNIVPNVSVKCRIMEGNTGYEDLMLLAQCQIIISSQGSFGPTAALMNPDCELLIRNKKVAEIPYAKREMQIM